MSDSMKYEGAEKERKWKCLIRQYRIYFFEKLCCTKELFIQLKAAPLKIIMSKKNR